MPMSVAFPLIRPPFGTHGVFHPASIAKSLRFARPTLRFAWPPFISDDFGVGHPIKTLPSVRGSDARSAEIDRPAGVTRVIQVRLNKVEPRESVD